MRGKHLRVGVVGCGNWGSNHIQTYSNMGHDVVTCDLDGNHRYRISDVMYQHEPLSAVSICTPHAYLAFEAVKALMYGVPCLIEKPVATSLMDALKIKATSEELDVLAMPAFIERFNPYLQELDAKSLTFMRMGPNAGRPLIWDLLIHDIDLAFHLGVEACTFDCAFSDESNWKWRSVGTQHTFHDGEALREEIQHFINCVNGEEQLRVTMEDAVRAVQVAEQIQNS